MSTYEISRQDNILEEVICRIMLFYKLQQPGFVRRPFKRPKLAAAADMKSENAATTLPQPEFGPQPEGESNKRKAEPIDPCTSDGQDASAFAVENAEKSSGQL